MPKDTTKDLERGQQTLSFSSAPRTSSSSSLASSSSGSSSHASSSTRGRGSSSYSGRGRGGGGRGGGGWSSSSGWQAKRDWYRNIAAENMELHIPLLVKDSSELSQAIHRGTVEYKSMPPTTEPSPMVEGKKTLFRFWNKDSFDAAEKLVRRRGSDEVAVLNMANQYRAGGGYVTGASAQEEALCRRSTLYEHINQPRFYPFHDEGGLWSAGVRVFRRGDDDDSRILDSEEQWNVGVISVAAIDTPRLTRDGKDYANSLEEQLTFHKIIAILRIAKLHQQRALVLGAFGCGAFHNPPLAMASLFRRALTELPEFTNVFEEVVFSILERSGSDNMRPWSETWRGLIADESQAAAKPSKVENKEEVIVLDD